MAPVNRRSFLRTLAVGVVGAVAAAKLPKALQAEAIPAGPLVDGAGQTGTSIVTRGWTSGCPLTRGDIVEFEGCFSINPVTHRSTGLLQQFVVTADAHAADGRATLEVWPTIIPRGVYQNVSASPKHHATIRQRRDMGYSIRFVRQFDMKDASMPTRLDVLYGVGVIQPNLACRVIG